MDLNILLIAKKPPSHVDPTMLDITLRFLIALILIFDI